MKSSPLIFVFVVGISVVSSSCTVGPNYKTPDAKVSDQWLANPAIAPHATGAAEIYWWRTFNDPVLNQLVEISLKQNLSLQAAGVRILETRATLNKSIGNLFPQQQGISSQSDYSKISSKTPGAAADYTSSQTLFAASWEVDIWGKYGRQIESDRATFLGTVAAYDDVMVTLIADVASAYINIRALEERIRVAQKNVEAQQESLRIATAQFKAGETNERDAQMASVQLAQTQAQVPIMKETLRQVKNGLAVLLGETPEAVDKYLGGQSRMPVVPATVAVGIPKDLLRRRPDVRVAGYTAASKSALIGVARAQMYPSLTLSGSFGSVGDKDGLSPGLFSWQNTAANAGAGIVFPIFNYGRLENEVRVQDARFEQALLNYQSTVLTAAKEVEDALATFNYQQEAVSFLTNAVTAAQRSADLAMMQYKSGETDYTTVVSAQQSALATEDALATAQGNVGLGLIATYRALGGGWEVRDGRDVISDEVKAEMAKRTNWGKMLEPSQHLPSTSPTDKKEK